MSSRQAGASSECTGAQLIVKLSRDWKCRSSLLNRHEDHVKGMTELEFGEGEVEIEIEVLSRSPPTPHVGDVMRTASAN
jgi:hypothetical protein